MEDARGFNESASFVGGTGWWEGCWAADASGIFGEGVAGFTTTEGTGPPGGEVVPGADVGEITGVGVGEVLVREGITEEINFAGEGIFEGFGGSSEK